MGQAALIFVLGMTIVMGRMLVSSNEQIISLSQKITARYEKIIARYIAISGANIALSNLSDNPQSRTNIASTSFNGGTFAVTVADLDSVVELSITGTYLDLIRTIEIITTARAPLEDLAIYTTGTVTNVVVLDEFSNPDPTLLVENQSSLPDIDNQALTALATSQGHVEVGEFSPADGYPNGPPGSFYYSDPTANVTHVLGDLRVKKDRTVYGIFLVEGDIFLEGSARVEGVLYLKNSGQIILSGSGRNRKSYVTGGIVANGDIDGRGNQIEVTYNSVYMSNFSATTNVTGQGGVEVISWKEL